MSDNEISGTVGQSVQAGTVQGDVHFHAAPGQDEPVPRQLPGAARHFVNRSVEQDALSTVLGASGGEGVVLLSTIDGTAGVGKSTLAVHWAHQRRDLFPDGELYVNLRGFDPVADPMSPAEALAIFLSALGVPNERVPEDEQARAALFRSALHGKRMLLLLDNARTAEQVRPLLPANPTCLVLVTSRNRLNDLVVHEGAARVGLQVLTSDEAHDLLGRYLGRERLAAEPEPVRALVEHCAGLPLALGIVAVRAAGDPDLPLEELVDELRDERERLDALDAGGATGVRAVLSWSYRSLSPEAARAFRLLGLPTGPDIGLAAATALLGTTRAKARGALAELTRAHLLDQPQQGRYEFHDLLRAYAAERSADDETADERQAALRRLLDHYLRTSTGVQEQLIGHARYFKPELPESEVEGLSFTDDDAALQWWDVEQGSLAAALRQAKTAGLHEHAWQLPYTLMYFYKLRGHAQEALAAFELGIEVSRGVGNARAEAHLLHDLSIAHYGAKDFTSAIGRSEQAQAAFAHIGDPRGEGDALIATGIFHTEGTGRLADAEDAFRRALELEREAGDRFREGQAHEGLACLHNERAEFDSAIPHFEDALRQAREDGEKFGEAFVLNGLSDAYFGTGRVDEAVNTYRQAAELRADIGHREGQAVSLRSLGKALRYSGDAAGARRAWEESLALFEDLGSPEADGLRAELAGAAE